MRLGNSETGYGLIAVALHWITMIGVIVMVLIGWRAGALEEAHDDAGHMAAMGWHFTIGATLLVFLIAQTVQYYAQKQPKPPEQAAPLKVISKITHHLLALGVLAMILSGPLMVWSSGHGIPFWGAEIPSPFTERNRAVGQAAHIVHVSARWALYFLIPLHVLGALKHLVVDKDGVFQRILAPSAK